MPWAVAGAVAGAATSSILGGSSSQQTSQAAGAADPFAQQRPQYMQQLQDMMNPNLGFTPQDPSYAFRFNQGMQAVNAGQAGSGMLNSGHRLMALEDYGQGTASTEYANQFSRLSQLSGANIGSPAAAGQITANGNAQQQGAASTLGNAVSTAVKGWGTSDSGGGGGSSWGNWNAPSYSSDMSGGGSDVMV